MTRKEAITILKDLWRYEHTYYTDKEVRTALDMAINALEQEPTKEEQALLKKWRDNRGVSIEEFEQAMDELQESKTVKSSYNYTWSMNEFLSKLRNDDGK